MEYLTLVLFLHCSIAFPGDVNGETVQEEEETGMYERILNLMH